MKRRTPLLASLAGVATLCAASRAVALDTPTTCGTTVPGGAVVGQTWTPAGSPYCVTGDLTVSGLTIQPGVTVLVDPGFSITVNVALVAVGTADLPIRFDERVAGSPWKGITFLNTPPGSQLTYCEIRHSDDAGIKIFDSSPTITRCLITENTTDGSTVAALGGGVHAFYNTTQSLTLEECAIVGNIASTHGGGVYARMAGGLLTVVGCSVTDNSANPDSSAGSYNGGGIWVSGDSLIAGCRVERNTVRACATTDHVSRGGGLYSVVGDAIVENCRFAENLAVTGSCDGLNTRRARGGGIYFQDGMLTMSNVTVGCNTTNASHERSGAGIYVLSGAADIRNCTVARNVSSGSGLYNSGGTVNVDSSILYFNDPLGACQFGPQAVGTVAFSYSCVQDVAPPPGPGNIIFSPAFADGTCDGGCACESLEILQFSPCIGTGNPAFPNACPAGPGDMGARGGPLNCGSRLDLMGADQGIAFCFGDGSGAACPCANNSPRPNEGCLHSGGLGMTINAAGTNRVSADDLELVAGQCPLGNTGIFYVGSVAINGGAGQQLFDGVQCVGGNVRRFRGRFQANGTVCDTDFVSQDPSGFYFVCGSTYNFQYWSRDVNAPSACGFGSNFSPAYRVVYGP